MLLKELGKVKHPDRVFHFPCQIWFPQRWIVTRHFYGEDEDISTVLTDTPINQTADAGHVPGPDEVLCTVHCALNDVMFTDVVVFICDIQ